MADKRAADREALRLRNLRYRQDQDAKRVPQPRMKRTQWEKQRG